MTIQIHIQNEQEPTMYEYGCTGIRDKGELIRHFENGYINTCDVIVKAAVDENDKILFSATIGAKELPTEETTKTIITGNSVMI